MKVKFTILFISLFYCFNFYSCKSKTPKPKSIVLTLQPGPDLGKDADITSTLPDRNSANNPFVDPYCWTSNGQIVTKRVFLEFDLSSIPKTAIIDSAKLNLYFSQKLLEEFNNFFTGHTINNNEIIIYRNTEAWNENTITWSKKPEMDSNIFKIVPAAKTEKQDYINIDVKNLIKEMKEKGNYGFQIRHTVETPYRLTCLTSSEEANPLIRPKLVVYYH